MMEKVRRIMTVAEMKDREAWLKVRNTGIGGSDAGTIVGLNPWKSAYQLWLEKTGQTEPEDISDREAVHFGNVLEEVVANEFAARTGKKVQRHGMLQSIEHPFLLANVDRMVVGEEAGLECKTASAYKTKAWEEDGLPDSYYVQCQHYMLVTGLPRWYIAALIGGNHFVSKCIERNEEDIKALFAAEADFWQHVRKNTPPPVDGSSSCSQALSERFLGGRSEVLTLDSKRLDAVMRLRELEQAKADIEMQIGEQRNILKEFMGDYETAVYGTEENGGRITWKMQKGRTTIDAKRLKMEQPDIYAEYSKQGSPVRVFRMA